MKAIISPRGHPLLKSGFYYLVRFVGVASLAAYISACAVKNDDAPMGLQPQDLRLDSKKIFLTTTQACVPHLQPQALLSFVGDNVLGDYKGSSGATFNAKFEEVGGDLGYFSLGVREVLQADDLSIGNMEGVLSDKPLKNAFDKPFSFKGASHYAKILTTAGFEAMNIANNHSRDYGKQGFEDTITHLRAQHLAVFGEGIVHIYEVNDIKIGLAGHRGWNLGIKPQVAREIKALRDQGAELVIFTFHWGEERQHYPNAAQRELAHFTIDSGADMVIGHHPHVLQGAELVIFTFHWGEERQHYPNAAQRELAHFTIDSGADMVIGHHPHVLQGVETYKGKKIVYSLGNFIYGGAKNPADKDSMIYQTRFIRLDSARKRREFIEDLRFDACAQEAYLEKPFIKGVERVDELGDFVLVHSVIPVSISSTPSYNDYSPRIYANDSKGFDRVLRRLESYSVLPTKKTPQKTKRQKPRR